MKRNDSNWNDSHTNQTLELSAHVCTIIEEIVVHQRGLIRKFKETGKLDVPFYESLSQAIIALNSHLKTLNSQFATVADLESMLKARDHCKRASILLLHDRRALMEAYLDAYNLYLK